MCLAIPGLVVSIDDSNPHLRMAKVDFGGVIKNVVIEWVEVTVGSYVLAHAGFAISRVDRKEAENCISVISRIVNELDKKDNE